jgi:hypothetical protein
MHPRCITNNDIVKHTTAPIVAQRVPILPGCVACAIHAVLKDEPVVNEDNEEVEELRPHCIVSFLINNKYELVNELALLCRGPTPSCAAEQQISIKFNGTEQEGVNPELARLYHMS